MSDSKKRKRVSFDLEEYNDTITFDSQLNDVMNKESWTTIIINMIQDIENTTSTYLDSQKIITELKESIINNQEGVINRCTDCGVDMGRSNPRQLCGKTVCYN